ncbi:hypothetical protein M8C21_014055, partial [Ambrosia artemisiifolia]
RFKNTSDPYLIQDFLMDCYESNLFSGKKVDGEVPTQPSFSFFLQPNSFIFILHCQKMPQDLPGYFPLKSPIPGSSSRHTSSASTNAQPHKPTKKQGKDDMGRRIWKYEGTGRTVDAALEHVYVNIQVDDGVVESELLLTGENSASNKSDAPGQSWVFMLHRCLDLCSSCWLVLLHNILKCYHLVVY